MDLKEINAGISGRYQAAVREVKRENRTCGFIRSAYKMLVAGDGNGNRIGDPIYFTGPARLKDIKVLQAQPGVADIHAQGEARAYERMTDETEEGSEQWSYLVWCAPAVAIRAEAEAVQASGGWEAGVDAAINALVAKRTGFRSLPDMFDTGILYRPSCDMRDPDMRTIADAYDSRAEAFGDPRRAYRYGGAA